MHENEIGYQLGLNGGRVRKIFQGRFYWNLVKLRKTYEDSYLIFFVGNHVSCCILHERVVWFKFILIDPRRVQNSFSGRIPKPSFFFEIMLDICEIKHLKTFAIKSYEIVTNIIFGRKFRQNRMVLWSSIDDKVKFRSFYGSKLVSVSFLKLIYSGVTH